MANNSPRPPPPVPLSRRLSLSNLTLNLTTHPVSQSSPLSSPAGSTDSDNSSIRGRFQRRPPIWRDAIDTDESRHLEDYLLDRDARNALVASLLASHSNMVMALRFITAFNEWKTNMEAMRMKKLIRVFFRPDSNFHIQAIPISDLKRVRNMDDLERVKSYFLSELLKITIVREVL